LLTGEKGKKYVKISGRKRGDSNFNEAGDIIPGREAVGHAYLKDIDRLGMVNRRGERGKKRNSQKGGGKRGMDTIKTSFF